MATTQSPLSPAAEMAAAPKRLALGMTGYQWTVLLAAWLGWGFDVFDGLLFNFVAANAVPTLLGLPLGSPEAQAATSVWAGVITSVVLLGWAAGGVIFGVVADRIGRTRTLLLTVLVYSLGTAACAFAPNLWVLLFFRLVAGLGIGGEWAAGASLVAEVVPERRRVEAGALLYTAAPFGLLLATFLNKWIADVGKTLDPAVSWRYVLASGLIAAVAALLVRVAVKEPERWSETLESRDAPKPSLADIFTPAMRARTISGLVPSVIVLICWWSTGAFLPLLAATLARQSAAGSGLGKEATLALVSQWQVLGNVAFDIGGLIGCLLTIPAARYLGRRRMVFVYLLVGALSLFGTFGLPLPLLYRLYGFFPIGLSIFGMFGSLTFYLPELFPTRLRATGSGFCYNVGRIVAAAGPFVVGAVAAGGVQPMLTAMFCLGVLPLVGLFLMPWILETRGRELD